MNAKRAIYRHWAAPGSLPVIHRFHRMLGSGKIGETVTASARWVQKVVWGERGGSGWQLVKEMGLLAF